MLRLFLLEKFHHFTYFSACLRCLWVKWDNKNLRNLYWYNLFFLEREHCNLFHKVSIHLWMSWLDWGLSLLSSWLIDWFDSKLTHKWPFYDHFWFLELSCCKIISLIYIGNAVFPCKIHKNYKLAQSYSN
jgi:hypothetical protein